MIDTIKIKSPTLSEADSAVIRHHLLQHMVRDNQTGEILREFTQGPLPGALGTFIKAHLTPVRDPDPGHEKASLVLEASPHKLMLGHNVTGGPLSFLPTCCWLIQLTAERLGILLPPADEWEVERVDWAEAYKMPKEAIPEIIDGYRNARYPRRRTRHVNGQSLSFTGVTTSVLLYHKGPEFVTSDRARLRNVLPLNEVVCLVDVAWNTLRGEVQIKTPKLLADFSTKPKVGQIADVYLSGVYDAEFARVIRENPHKDLVARRESEVREQLQSCYPGHWQSLFGLWCILARTGEDAAKKSIPRATFFRQCQKIRSAGCSWLNTDVSDRTGLIPADFSLTRDSPYRDTGEDLQVIRQFTTFGCAETLQDRRRPFADIPDAHFTPLAQPLRFPT